MPAPTSAPIKPPAAPPAPSPARPATNGPASTTPSPGMASVPAAASTPTITPATPPIPAPAAAPSADLLPSSVSTSLCLKYLSRVSFDISTLISSFLYPRSSIALYAASALCRSRNVPVSIPLDVPGVMFARRSLVDVLIAISSTSSFGMVCCDVHSLEKLAGV